MPREGVKGKRFGSLAPHLWRNAQGAGFTLIELLVVIAILAVLSVAVVLVLNPAQLLAEARDSTRLSDLASLNTALSLFQVDQYDQNLGTASTTYISVPDTSPTCQNLGLPSLPSGWSYHCVPSSSSSLVNGQGWIPVNFTLLSTGSPLSKLPLDPINTTSTGEYYTYTPGGSYELTAIPESTKYKAQYVQTPSLTQFPGVMAQGSDLSLSPLYNPSGLVGWWPLDGNGNDMSGYGDNGTVNSQSVYSGGIVGQALSQNASVSVSTLASVPYSASLPFNFGYASNFTISAWVDITSMATETDYNRNSGIVMKNGGTNSFGIFLNYNNLLSKIPTISSGVRDSTYRSVDTPGLSMNTWYLITMTYQAGSLGNATLTAYLNGNLLRQSALTGLADFSNTNPLSIGSVTILGGNPTNFRGLIDDVRIYNRALSAAEVQALYNAEK